MCSSDLTVVCAKRCCAHGSLCTRHIQNLGFVLFGHSRASPIPQAFLTGWIIYD